MYLKRLYAAGTIIRRWERNRTLPRNNFAITGLCAMHILISTIGVVILSGFVVFAALASLRIFGLSFSAVFARHLLTEIPLFPVQALIGALVGFCLGRYVSRGVINVLLCIPVLCLACGVIMGYERGVPFASYFFGYGCTAANRCFDQFLITLPAVTSVAYVCGIAVRSWFASKVPTAN
jgi:hypothetical protein